MCEFMHNKSPLLPLVSISKKSEFEFLSTDIQILTYKNYDVHFDSEIPNMY